MHHCYDILITYYIFTYILVIKVWHTSVLNKLDQVVATSYSRNHAEVCVCVSL